MGNFNQAYVLIKQNEGLYNPGGTGIKETYAGIDRGANPSWTGWKIIDSHKPATTSQMNLILAKDAALQADIVNFYVNNYFNPLKLAQVMDQNIVNNCLDCSVNQGVGIASKFMQMACNTVIQHVGEKIGLLVVDGIIGMKTIAIINALESELVYNEINTLRRNRYIDTANSNPSKKGWLKAWITRLTPYNHSLNI